MQPTGNNQEGQIVRQQPPRPPMVPRPPMPQGQEEMGITPKEIFGIVRRHLIMIFVFTVLGTFAGGVSWYLLLRFAPKYTARTVINVLPPTEDDPLSLAGRIPDEDYYYQFRATKSAYIKQQNMLQELLQDDDIKETDWYNKFEDPVERFEALDDSLGAHASREMNFIHLNMTCGSAAESAKILNEMVELFLRSQQRLAQRDVGAQLEERRSQLNNMEQDLATAESIMESIRSGTNFGEIATEGNFRGYLTEKLQEVEIDYNRLESEVSRLAQEVEILRARAQGSYDEVLREQMERDPIANEMRQRIAILEVNLAQQLARFGENHRRVRETRDSLNRAKSDLQDRQNEIADIIRQANLRNATDTLTTLTTELETLEKQRQQAQIQYKTLDNLKARYEKALIARDKALERVEELRMNVEKLNMKYNDPELSKLQSVGETPPPLRPSFPNLVLFVPAGFMLGAMAGLGLAFAVELLNDKLRTPSDVIKVIDVPMLGMIFHEKEDHQLDNVDARKVAQQAPYSILSEGYRQLRTNFKMSGSVQSRKTVFVSSCRIGCGKTSVAVNLASTLVGEGNKVLLIDTNLRSPMIYKLHSNGGPAKSDIGLSNYLMGQCEEQEIIKPTGIEDLDMVPAGPLPKKTAALLGNQKMKDLLEHTRSLYDYVIVDGPPLFVSDAKILASEADAAMLVFNASATRKGEAKRVLRELKEIDANVIGAVLLGVKIMKGGYFQEMFKSYQRYHNVQEGNLAKA